MFNRQHIIDLAEHIRRILLLCLYSTFFSGPALPKSFLLLTEAGLHCLWLGEFYTATFSIDSILQLCMSISENTTFVFIQHTLLRSCSARVLFLLTGAGLHCLQLQGPGLPESCLVLLQFVKCTCVLYTSYRWNEYLRRFTFSCLDEILIKNKQLHSLRVSDYILI